MLTVCSGWKRHRNLMLPVGSVIQISRFRVEAPSESHASGWKRYTNLTLPGGSAIGISRFQVEAPYKSHASGCKRHTNQTELQIHDKKACFLFAAPVSTTDYKSYTCPQNLRISLAESALTLPQMHEYLNFTEEKF